jgi:hypothetical protein
MKMLQEISRRVGQEVIFSFSIPEGPKFILGYLLQLVFQLGLPPRFTKHSSASLSVRQSLL